MRVTLPTDKKLRKQFPIGEGVLGYFPDAIAATSHVSYVGNAQHNGPDSPLQWTRGKSDDHTDTVIRHYMERGGFDVDGTRHSAKLVWRALAILQLEIEADRAAGKPGLCAADVTDPSPDWKPFEAFRNANAAAQAGYRQPDTLGKGGWVRDLPDYSPSCGITGEH